MMKPKSENQTSESGKERNHGSSTRKKRSEKKDSDDNLKIRCSYCKKKVKLNKGLCAVCGRWVTELHK